MNNLLIVLVVPAIKIGYLVTKLQLQDGVRLTVIGLRGAGVLVYL